MVDSLKAWFKGLTEREQKLVLSASIIAIIGIFYFALYQPLNESITTQQKALAADKALLSWVEEQSNRATILRQSANQTSFSGSLTQVVNQTTRNASIPVARMQPQGEELIVTIDQVEFNALIQWLAVLEQRGVRIVQSDVSEVNAQGFVQVRRLQLGK